MRKILFLQAILLIFSACSDDKCQESLTFVNESQSKIWYGLGKGNLDNFPCGIGIAELSPNESFAQLSRINSCWEDDLNGISYEGSLAIYFFSERPNAVGTDCVVEELNQLVIERREYTVEDLNALNWTIVYPQEEN